MKYEPRLQKWDEETLKRVEEAIEVEEIRGSNPRYWEDVVEEGEDMKPGVYDVGPHRLSWLCRFVTDWMGDDGFLKKLSGFLRRPNIVGDVTWLKGRLERKWIENEEYLVQCRLCGENQLKEETLQGYAVIRLPSRSKA